MAAQSGSFFQDNSNPFADPSIRAVAQAKVPEPDYNPFAQPAIPRPQTAPAGANNFPAPTSSQPALLAPSQSTTPPLQPPPYSSNAGNKITQEELDRRQRELEERDAEIQRREQELNSRSGGSGGGGPPSNFPPLPRWCPVGPCFYQDIDIEIPLQYKSSVRWGFRLWVAHAVFYFVNIIGCIFYFAGAITISDKSTAAGTTLGFSILFFFLLTPCSYVCWFRPFYNAFKSDSSINFFIFFFVTLFQVLILIIWAIGIPSWYSAGFINGLSMIGDSLAAAIVMMICGAFAAVLAALDISLVLSVHRFYRSSGMSLDKARSEMTTSDGFRGIVSAGAGVAARSAFDSFGNTASNR